MLSVMRGDLSLPSKRLICLPFAICLLGLAAPAWAVDLPEKAPIPQVRDETAASEAKKGQAQDRKQDADEALPEKAPLPKDRPEAGREDKPEDSGAAPRSNADPEKSVASPKQDEAETPPAASDEAKPSDDAEPEAGKPASDDESHDKAKDDDAEDGGPAPASEPDIPPPLSEKGKACRGDLRSLGVAFTEDDPVDSDEGCAIPHPLTITTLGKDITIEPKAEMNCTMAETLADFMQDVVQPAAERHFNKLVKAVRHASAFVCRPRNGTRILSEHAFGNALDIAAFVLEDGTEIAVKAYDPEDHDTLDKAQFLNEVRAAACGPFTTVLGPGAADHDTHFHLDLRGRNNRYKVCE